MATQQTFSFLDVDLHLKTPPHSAPKQSKTPVKPTPTPISTAAAPPHPQPKPAQSPPTREALLDRLRAQAGCMTHVPNERSLAVFSSGCETLDRLLPGGGLPLHALTEYVAQSEASGASTLSLVAVASLVNSTARRRRGPVMIIDMAGTFYPPSAIALGIAPERIVWVRPKRLSEAVWAMDQSLRSPGVAVVWGMLGSKLDDRDARRLQLASEAGPTPGLVIRPAAARRQPSFAEVRLAVASLPVPATTTPVSRTGGAQALARIWRVTVDRCRGSHTGSSIVLELNERSELRSLAPAEIRSHEKTSAVRLATQLADPATKIAIGDTRQHA
jgi:hypothetical protein